MNQSKKGSWLVVYMCRGRRQTMDVEKMLTDEGFLVRSHALEHGTGEETYEIYALESEAHEARNLILEKGL